MFSRKQFRGIAVFTLFIFTFFTLAMDYSYSQEENPLLKAQGLYKQGNFIEAVKVLEAFIEKIKGNPNEKKRLPHMEAHDGACVPKEPVRARSLLLCHMTLTAPKSRVKRKFATIAPKTGLFAASGAFTRATV